MTKVPTEQAEIPIEYSARTSGVETRNFDTVLLDSSSRHSPAQSPTD